MEALTLVQLFVPDNLSGAVCRRVSHALQVQRLQLHKADRSAVLFVASVSVL